MRLCVCVYSAGRVVNALAGIPLEVWYGVYSITMYDDGTVCVCVCLYVKLHVCTINLHCFHHPSSSSSSSPSWVSDVAVVLSGR